jgi:hypothetical protein
MGKTICRHVMSGIGECGVGVRRQDGEGEGGGRGGGGDAPVTDRRNAQPKKDIHAIKLSHRYR